MPAPPPPLATQREETFEAVFDRHFRDVHGYVARRLGRDLADDVAAETFLTAFRLNHRFDTSKGNRLAWLYGIASNLVRRHRRDEVRGYRAMARLDPADTEASHDDRVVNRVSVEQLRGALAGALAGLCAGDRDVLLLIALAGLTYEQVAEALGISYGAVCSRLNRARRKVRAALGDDHEGLHDGRTAEDPRAAAPVATTVGPAGRRGPRPAPDGEASATQAPPAGAEARTAQASPAGPARGRHGRRDGRGRRVLVAGQRLRR